MSGQEFEAVIGLEVHCQLSTESKIFVLAVRVSPKGPIAENWRSTPMSVRFVPAIRARCRC
jgi:Asp-tRNA(Asn)/Glu-tRNA(Gln) amidotransferase B subunit